MSTNDEQVIINLANHGTAVYAGRPKGEKLREKYHLDDIDNNTTKVVIIVPENTYSVNSSFFLALLGDSIRKCGSKDAFLEKFEIDSSEALFKKFIDYISRALREKNPLTN